MRRWATPEISAMISRSSSRSPIRTTVEHVLEYRRSDRQGRLLRQVGQPIHLVTMTPEEETELAHHIIGAWTSALVVPDDHAGSNWIPGRMTAAEAARGTSLPPLTVSEARIAANLAAVLGGYRDRLEARPDDWR
jgi:hypothetical protein